MNIELLNADATAIQENIEYAFVVDAELAHIGGGQAVVDY